jgi:hypothetical protein
MRPKVQISSNEKLTLSTIELVIEKWKTFHFRNVQAFMRQGHIDSIHESVLKLLVVLKVQPSHPYHQHS